MGHFTAMNLARGANALPYRLPGIGHTRHWMAHATESDSKATALQEMHRSHLAGATPIASNAQSIRKERDVRMRLKSGDDQ